MKADLSIIVTSYNKSPEQIAECMDSIKEQTVSPKEVILVDDCSDDPRAHAIATSIMLPKNVGVAKARDIGVRMSSSNILLFLDADDKLSADFIYQCGKEISKVDIVYPSSILFGNVEKNEYIEAPNSITKKYILGKKSELVVTSMMHKRVYKDLGGFRKMELFEDWDFWVRAKMAGFTFKKANTFLWYRQNIKSRNRASKELKSSIHRKIVAPYLKKDGK